MRLLVASLCLLLATATMQAQSTAQVSGTVKDASGLAVPGAEIKATQTATGLVRTATSGADGGYVLTNLPIGPYQVEVSKEGFSKYVQSGIVLQVDSNPTIDTALKVGAVSEQVTVQADASLVETHSTGVGTVVDNQRVLEMPLNGRQVTDLIFLAGMANNGAGSGSANSIRNYPTVVISVAGGTAGQTEFLLDGANHNDAHNNLNLPMPFPDALQEFKLETSALPAQYGVHGAATVNAVTKSGTNDLHGDLFEFLRNGDFNARDTYAVARDTLKRSQFGGVVGGRVIKDKLFFFGGYQGTIQKSTPSQSIAYVPSAAMIAGDFTGLESPGCNGNVQKNLNAPFVGNKIAPSLLNPVALNLEKLMPISTDPCGKIVYGLVQNQSEHLAVTRVDWQKSEKNSIFGRYTFSHLDQPTTYDGHNPVTISAAGALFNVHTVAIGDTYLIGSGTVSSFRVSGERTVIPKIADNFVTWKALGSNVAELAPGEAKLTVTGNGFAIGGGSSHSSRNGTGPNPQVSEDISMIRGNHQFGFGASFLYNMAGFVTLLNAPATFTFSGIVSGAPLADLMTGNASGFLQGNVGNWYDTYPYFGAYAQDSWKVNSRLTVNYGIRFEPFFALSAKTGGFTHFDQSLFSQGVHSTVYANGPAGLIVPGDPQYTIGNHPEGNKVNRWAPRLGIVWDPFGNGKTIVRAAYGIFTDHPYIQEYTGFGTNPPIGNNISLANVNLTNPWANYPLAGGNTNPFPLVTGKNLKFGLAGTYLTSNFNEKAPYLNQWNLSLQRQIGTDWLLQANYIGNNEIHLMSAQQIDPAVFLGLGACTIKGPGGTSTNYPVCSTTANTNQRRALYLQNPDQGQYYSAVAQVDQGGTGTYDGLYLSVTKRLSQGVSVLANYTWSHCISDYFEPQYLSGAAVSPPGNRRAFRGNCPGSDQRQVFNSSFVLQTPKFANAALRMLATGWQISPIVKFKTGPYFTISTGVDNALNGQAGTAETPNLVLSNIYAANKGVTGWLNRNAFAVPANGTSGNFGYNVAQAPGLFQLDMAISRTFKVREKMTVQFRGEAFNLPNWVNLGIPVSALNSAAFGQIQNDTNGSTGAVNSSGATGDPRIIQFALKLIF